MTCQPGALLQMSFQELHPSASLPCSCSSTVHFHMLLLSDLKSELSSALLFWAVKSAKPETKQQQNTALPRRRKGETCVFSFTLKPIGLPEEAPKEPVIFNRHPGSECIILCVEKLGCLFLVFSYVCKFLWRLKTNGQAPSQSEFSAPICSTDQADAMRTSLHHRL